MDNAWTGLAWDSEFFGFPTARILPPRLGATGLEVILEEMRSAGVVLAYWAADPLDPSSDIAAEAHGGFPADDRITFVRDLGNSPPAQAVHALPFFIAPLAEADKARWKEPLAELGLRSGMHSRFRADPRFPPEAFRRLYAEWLRKSLTGERADAVLVASRPAGLGEDGPEVQGLVTVTARGGEGDIGLLAIAEGCEGRGLGTALATAALEWFFHAGCGRARVVTQGRNKGACRVYAKAGFGVERREEVHHFWLADLPVTRT